MSEDGAHDAPVLAYATPSGLERRGPWREGKLIVKPQGASLPDRCVRCNAPAVIGAYDVLHHYPTFELVTSGAYRNLRVPLCAAHAAERKRRKRRATVAAVAGGALMVSLVFLPLDRMPARTVPTVFLIASASFLVAQVLARRARPLRLRRVSHGCLYLAGGSPAFLEGLDAKR